MNSSKLLYMDEPALLLKIGESQTLKDEYDKQIIKFGCAANWVQHEWTSGNNQTGDVLEGCFGRVLQNDERACELRNNSNLGNHLLEIYHENHLSYFYYMPTILTPAFCLYNISKKLLKANLSKFYPSKNDTQQFPAKLQVETLTFLLREYEKEYYQSSFYKPGKHSVLIIKDPYKFLKELKTQIPLAVQQNKENLSSKGFSKGFFEKNPMMYASIQYTRKKNELYWQPKDYNLTLFKKLKRYKYQSEFRIIIPGIRYNQPLEAPISTYCYQKNQLEIFLPKLKEYTELIDIKEFDSIEFIQYNGEYHFKYIKRNQQ